VKSVAAPHISPVCTTDLTTDLTADFFVVELMGNGHGHDYFGAGLDYEVTL